MANQNQESPQESNEPTTIHQHYCVACKRSFSSGKALGGHMSSAHVQATIQEQDNNASQKLVCAQCGKEFPSRKALFGHMRSHPERQWRGMAPPPPPPSAGIIIGSPEPKAEYSLEIGSNKGLLSWNVRDKRGRPAAFNNPDNKFSNLESTNEVVYHRAKKLLMMVNDEIEENMGKVENLKMHQADETEKSPEFSSETSEPDSEDTESTDIDKEIVSNNAAIDQEKVNKPMELAPIQEGSAIKIMKVQNFKRHKPQGPAFFDHQASEIHSKRKLGKEALENSKNTTEPMKLGDRECHHCGMKFGSHQALGGHMASHKKLIIRIYNTIDHVHKKQAPEKKKKKKSAKGTTNVVQPENTEVPRKVLAFDLNEMPDEEE